LKQIIEKQNQELKQYNVTLEVQVQDRTKELSETNMTLAENNEQLQQFAYIISHNLRAPIARIQGLAEVVNHTKAGTREQEMVLLNMTASAQELDQIIRDLHKILEIRKGLDNILEQVDLKTKAEQVCQMLNAEIQEANAQIDFNFEVTTVKAVSSYIESILYNLISNAIKYRSDSRSVHVNIRSHKNESGIELIIADNGLGIELSKHGEKIFGLYKRFHLHREGKGMGLYLVKTQVEAMGGKITLDSTPSVGTTFYIQLPSRF
jgi:signal transduction histidine kinase